MRKPWLKYLLLILLGLLISELLLRGLLGMGQLPLYQSSPDYEYALQADQSMKRFAKRFEINEHGMRSAPLESGEFRVLKFGDSVLNGGVATDQEELATHLLEQGLHDAFPHLKARVLQVSAGSWGPDNAFAWMREHGHFEARIIGLLFSSHDYRDHMDFRQVVGNVPFYPDRQPRTAIGDLFTWLYARYGPAVDWEQLPGAPQGPEPKGPNSGWADFAAYCHEEGIALYAYHHPSYSEWRSGQWSAEGDSLQALLQRLEIPCINGLHTAYSEASWRDEIHPNALGQQAIAAAIMPRLIREIESLP